MATFSNGTTPSHLTTPHVSILDFFIPGFTVIFTAAEQLLAGKLNGFASLLCVSGILLYSAKHVSSYVWELVERHLTSTIHVQYSEAAYDMLITWVSSQPFARTARSSLARISWGRIDADYDGTEKKPLSYSPWNGTYFFFHKKRLYWFRSIQKEVGFRIEEVVTVSCLSRCPGVLKELFSHCRTEYLKMTQNKTSIFEPREDCWRSVKARNIRPMSTVIMNENEKALLLKDITAYLASRARVWYSNRGLPYRRGYLLYGPPGTGKSSLSLSIAGHFGLDIYMLNISSVTGGSLSDLLADLPPQCVLLLEDVDAVDMTQSRQAGETAHKESSAKNSKGKLCLSELLNALDGVSSHEGRILIMTTNHIERLDAALIRSGRADRKIELPHADKDMIARLFCMVFKQAEGDISDPENPADDDKTVERLANEFANKVPEREFSPAEIQSFLVQNRESSRMPVKNVEDWMTRTRMEKVKRAGSSGSEETVMDVSPDEILHAPIYEAYPKEGQNKQTSSPTSLSRAPTLSVHTMDGLMPTSTETIRAAQVSDGPSDGDYGLPGTMGHVKEMIRDSVLEAMRALKYLRKDMSLLEEAFFKSELNYPLPKDEGNVALRLEERLIAAFEKLVAARGVPSTTSDGVQVVARTLQGLKPLWTFTDNPDHGPALASYHAKLLITAVEKLGAEKTVANTPPPSESGGSTDASKQYDAPNDAPNGDGDSGAPLLWDHFVNHQKSQRTAVDKDMPVESEDDQKRDGEESDSWVNA